MLGGTSSRNLYREVLFDPCSFCGKRNTLELTIYQKYFHILFLPFFPFRKKSKTNCSHCKQELEYFSFNKTVKERFLELKKELRTPWWMFMGSYLFFILLCIGFYRHTIVVQQNYSYASSPLIGDMYEVEISYAKLILMRVDSVTTDSIYFTKSDSFVCKSSELHLLYDSEDSTFSDKKIVWGRELTKNNVNKELVKFINRKSN